MPCLPVVVNNATLRRNTFSDAPGRPLLLFVSPWQLSTDGLPAPRPGWRIEGHFLFTGVIAGGLPGPRRAITRSFG